MLFEDDGLVLVAEGLDEGCVDLAVAFGGAGVVEGVSAGDDEGEGPVVAVINHAAAGRAAGEVHGARVGINTLHRGVRGEEEGELFADVGDLLSEAERKGGRAPVVVAKPGVSGFGVTLQQKKIRRHVLGRAGGAVGKKVELHVEKKSGAESPEPRGRSRIAKVQGATAA